MTDRLAKLIEKYLPPRWIAGKVKRPCSVSYDPTSGGHLWRWGDPPQEPPQEEPKFVVVRLHDDAPESTVRLLQADLDGLGWVKPLEVYDLISDARNRKQAWIDWEREDREYRERRNRE